MDMDIQVVNQLAGLNPTMLENLKLTDFQVGGTEFPASNYHFPPTTSQSDCANARTIIHSKALAQDVCNHNKMKKVMEPANVISSTAFVNGLKVNNDTIKKNGLGKGNKGRNGEIKLGEVIHLRARRGQATDSHSLAERVRRQRINSRFKRLQDIVPGCHETMGMAVMLDEIINYVQSLQNQVEFLSMELASASSSYDFNSDRDHAIGRNTAPEIHASEQSVLCCRRRTHRSQRTGGKLRRKGTENSTWTCSI